LPTRHVRFFIGARNLFLLRTSGSEKTGTTMMSWANLWENSHYRPSLDVAMGLCDYALPCSVTMAGQGVFIRHTNE
jgi:hypothetical protein